MSMHETEQPMLFDWKRGKWELPSPSAGSAWRMTVASDWAPILAYEPIMIERPEAIYGDLLGVLHASDLNVVNVEAVLGDAGEATSKDGGSLRGDARTVRALAAGEFQIACLANNHIMDFGPAGLRSTLATLESAQVETVGAGFDREQIERPAIRRVNGVSVGIINYAEGEEACSSHGEAGVRGMDVAGVARQIEQLKARGDAEVVVVIFHGGREHVPVPPPYVVHQLRQIAEAGADAVVAHHPHVPQGIEIHQDVPIAYSLGNFVLWQGPDLAYRRMGYLLHLDFVGAALTGCALTPYVLGPEGLRTMDGPLRARFADRMAEASAPLADPAQLRAAWSAFAAEAGPAAALERLAQLVANAQNPRDRKAVAKLKNCFFTPAHRAYYCELLDQQVGGIDATAPTWARELVRRWLSSTAEAEGLDDVPASHRDEIA